VRRKPLLESHPLSRPELGGVDDPAQPVVLVGGSPLDQQARTSDPGVVARFQNPAVSSGAQVNASPESDPLDHWDAEAAALVHASSHQTKVSHLSNLCSSYVSHAR